MDVKSYFGRAMPDYLIACLLAQYGTMYVAAAMPATEHMETMWPPFSSMSGRNSKMVQNCEVPMQNEMRFVRLLKILCGKRPRRTYLRISVDLENLSDRLPVRKVQERPRGQDTGIIDEHRNAAALRPEKSIPNRKGRLTALSGH